MTCEMKQDPTGYNALGLEKGYLKEAIPWEG